jgi:putative component of membrane protein insertase Oxa1/YidC/SpoIIIJ protein YidD
MWPQVTKAVIRLLKGYRRFVQYWRNDYQCRCPDTECCWDYSFRVLEEHGLKEGIWLAASKVSQCGKALTNGDNKNGNGVLR